MECELCGKENVSMIANVEGTILKVCEKCGKHGKIIKIIKQTKKEMPKKESISVNAIKNKVPEIEEDIVEDYAEKIKKAREKLGLKQEDFAKIIKEKDSLIHHIETGHMKPSIALAKKIEKFLKIKLIEEVEMKNFTDLSNKKNDELTLGDIITIKKK